MTDELHIPRQNLDAEQSALGAMMMSDDAAAEGAALLRADDFYRKAHADIFLALKSLAEHGEHTDFITLSERLARLGTLDDLGGPAYLSVLYTSVPSAANLRTYCAIVTDAAKVRRFEVLGQRMQTWAQDATLSGDELEQRLWAEAEKQLIESRTVGTRDMREWAMEVCERLNEAEDTPVYPTGFPYIDNALDGGLLPGTMNVLAGYPKMGKTTIAMNILARLPHTCRIGISSLEMRPEYLLAMLIGQRSGISPRKIRKAIGRANVLDADEIRGAHEACGELYTMPWWIGGRDSRDVEHLVAEARRRVIADEGLDVWMIDHAQLLRLKGAEGRRVEAENTVRRITEFALSTNTCVLLLSQLRKPDTEHPPRPTPHSLKETAALSEDPTTVLMIHRKEAEGQQEITLELAHNRFGPTAMAHLKFDEEMQRFGELAEREGP